MMKFPVIKNFRFISSRMMQMALPIAVSGLIMQVQVLIDTAFLARYSTTLPDGSFLSGTEILSAVGNVFFPYIVTLSFLWSITTGIVILVSQQLGANRPNQARSYAFSALKFNAIISWLFYGFWFLFGEQVFQLLGVRQPILSISIEYLRFISLEFLYLGILNSVGAVFQGMGNTRPEMFTGIIRSLLHIFLDYILIFGSFGFPEMGVMGAGLASSISGLTACIILVTILFKTKNTAFVIDIKSILSAPFSDYLVVLKKGLPVGLEDMLWNLGNLTLAYFLNLINIEAVGIYRLVYQIEVTPVYFYIGLARAVTTMVGNKTGERDLPAARRVGLTGSIYTVGFCLLFTSSFLIFPRQIISIFTGDGDLVQKSIPLLMMTAVTMIPRSINIISGHGIRGYGDTMWMLVTQIFGIVFVITLSYFLMFPAGFGMLGLFMGMFVDELLRGSINTVRFYIGENSPFHKANILPISVDIKGIEV